MWCIHANISTIRLMLKIRNKYLLGINDDDQIIGDDLTCGIELPGNDVTVEEIQKCFVRQTLTNMDYFNYGVFLKVIAL